MDLKKIKTFEQLKQAKHEFYQSSDLIKLKKMLKEAEPNKKMQLGQKLQKILSEAEQNFIKKQCELEKIMIDEKIASEWVDVNEPFQSFSSLHPLNIIANRFRTWLVQNNYYETSGSDFEDDLYNFERLNIGPNHPARDMQASLYIDEKILLRTHNTGYSARELEKNVNQAFNQFAIGKVYRNDEDDATHSHQFMQVDLVSVGTVSMANLIWTLKSLLTYVLEKDVEIRLRPSFFPFTEPSIEMDIKHQDKWVEVLGAGMLNEKVLKAAKYSNYMNGFAAGIGIDRIAMIKYGIKDIRTFYKNDLRFLSQFKGVI